MGQVYLPAAATVREVQNLQNRTLECRRGNRVKGSNKEVPGERSTHTTPAEQTHKNPAKSKFALDVANPSGTEGDISLPGPSPSLHIVNP